MNRGDLATALDIWDFWSEIPNHKRIMVISCHALAWIWMLQGRLEEAKKLQIENNTFELKALQRVGLAKTGAADLALIHALLGELDDATRWLATAEQRNKPPQMPNGPPMVILTRAVIALRRGEIDSALQELDQGWTLCESRFPISTMRTLRAIRAFGRIASGPRNAGTAYEDIAAIRPRFPGEHQFLATAWPDMAAFLATNGLA